MQTDISLSDPVKTLTLSLSVPQSLQVDEDSARELLVLALVERGRLSQSQGARVLGMSRYDFIQLMGTCGIPITGLGPAEQEEEAQLLQKLKARRDSGDTAPIQKRKTSKLKHHT